MNSKSDKPGTLHKNAASQESGDPLADFKKNALPILTPSQPLPRDIISATNDIVQLPGVDKAVLLPDFHLKQKYLMADYKINVPSSMVVSSDPQALFPQFRSRGIGCGMILVGTGLFMDDVKGVNNLFSSKLHGYLSNDISSHVEPQQGRSRSFVLSETDMVHMCLQGASWICRQFDVPEKNLDAFWKQGSFLSDAEAHDFSWEGLDEAWKRGRAKDGRMVGIDLSGNHFLEAQFVQEVPDACPNPLLRPGELVFLYHGSCNGLESVLDQSVVEHLIKRPTFVSFSPRQWEYHTIFRAMNILLNWGAASRCLVMARLRNLLSRVFDGMPLDGLRCVCEAPHNAISIEVVGGRETIVYRHNAVPILHGRGAIVSGRFDHASYLFLPGAAHEHSLSSLDHGIGKIIERSQTAGHALRNQTSLLTEQQYCKGIPVRKHRRTMQLIDPAAVEPYFRAPYVSRGLVREGCYVMQPIATIKSRSVSLRRMLRGLKHR